MPRLWPIVMPAHGEEEFAAGNDALPGICCFIGIKIRSEALFVDHESVQRGVEGGLFFYLTQTDSLGSLTGDWKLSYSMSPRLV